MYDSLSNSPGETSSDETSGGKEGERVQNSGSDSLGSGAVSEQLVDRKESSSHELENYADIGLVRDNAPSYTPAQSQQQQNPPHLPNFSVSPLKYIDHIIDIFGQLSRKYIQHVFVFFDHF